MNNYNRIAIPLSTGGAVFSPEYSMFPITGMSDTKDAFSSSFFYQYREPSFPQVSLAGSIAASSMLSTTIPSPWQREEDYMPFRLQESLRAIRALPENWNDHGANRFTDRLIDRAKRVLSTLCIDDERLMVFPTASKSIQIEWENASEDYCEIDVHADHESILTMEGDVVLVEIKDLDTSDAIKGFMNFVRRHIN
ncbi:MAG: hypothetical protein R8J84_05370 [Mariprofundales bacterium]